MSQELQRDLISSIYLFRCRRMGDNPSCTLLHSTFHTISGDRCMTRNKSRCCTNHSVRRRAIVPLLSSRHHFFFDQIKFHHLTHCHRSPAYPSRSIVENYPSHLHYVRVTQNYPLGVSRHYIHHCLSLWTLVRQQLHQLMFGQAPRNIALLLNFNSSN